jgi:hypothetical protein
VAQVDLSTSRLLLFQSMDQSKRKEAQVIWLTDFTMAVIVVVVVGCWHVLINDVAGGIDDGEGDNTGGDGGDGRIRFDYSIYDSQSKRIASIPTAYIDQTSLLTCRSDFLHSRYPPPPFLSFIKESSILLFISFHLLFEHFWTDSVKRVTLLGSTNSTTTTFFIPHNTPPSGAHHITVVSYNAVGNSDPNPSIPFHDRGNFFLLLLLLRNRYVYSSGIP